MGSRLLGEKYDIIRKIGTGGTSEVYLAIDRSTETKKALKIPRIIDKKTFDSIKNEYRFAARHCHPAILKPDSLFYDSEKPILASPFLSGVGLDKCRNHLIPNSGKDDNLTNMSNILAAILECAEFIHFSGHCYNDFKPSNFILENQSESESNIPSKIILIDFNLVTVVGEKPSRRGTLHYIAPEILCGEYPRPHSDIYSIGAAIYEIMTGSAPYDSSDESELIKNITDFGHIDFGKVPAKFREGLSSMLSRDPSRRPKTAAEAAEILKIESHFMNLKQSNTEYYLASGPPPFADDLKICFDEYRKRQSSRVFLIYGYSHHNIAINYLESEYNLRGIKAERISASFDNYRIKTMLENIKNQKQSDHEDKLLFIDNLELLDSENIKTIREILTTKKNVRVAACAGRWLRSGLKCEFFDPLNIWTIDRASEESLKTCLKQKHLSFENQPIRYSSGGDPELIFYNLKSLISSQGFELNAIDNSELKPYATLEIKYIYDRMIKALTANERELISLLSVWGCSVPLLIFIKLDKDKHEIIGSLIKKGCFIREKDTLRFFSGGFKNYIYEGIPEPIKKERHGFWAESAEELLTDHYQRLEIVADHWGKSNDVEKGYSANLEAANEFYLKRDYQKAIGFAERLMELPLKCKESRTKALIIGGKIQSAVGNFKTARKMFLKILKTAKANSPKAEAAKDLATLYLSEEIYSKSIYYCNLALKLLEPLNRKGKIAECRKLLFRAVWAKKEYALALNLLRNAGIKDKTGKTDYSKRKNYEALKQLSIALEYSKKQNDIGLEILALIGSGSHYLNIGDFALGKKYFSRALEQSERLREKEQIIDSLSNLGKCHLLSGDLFMAIECFNNARQTAESIGNIHLKALSELGLVDVALEMGNYSLANQVLIAIENDTIYTESNRLKLETDFRRASLSYEVGDYISAIAKLEKVIKSAGIRGLKNIALNSEIIIAAAKAEGYRLNMLTELRGVYTKAKDLDSNDIAARASLAAGKIYFSTENFSNASVWLEEAFMKDGASKKTKLEAAIYLAEIQARNNYFAESVEGLIETESITAASGYIPLAFQSASALGHVYKLFSKNDLGNEAYRRSADYCEKLESALPKKFPKTTFRQKPMFARFKSPTENVLAMRAEKLATVPLSI